MVPSAAMWSPLGHHRVTRLMVTTVSVGNILVHNLSSLQLWTPCLMQCMKMIYIIISLVYLARVLFIAKSNIIINSMNA